MLLSRSLPGVLSISLPAPWWRWENVPDYTLIMRYVNNIADLYIRYAGKVVSEQMPELESAILNNMNVLGEDDVPDHAEPAGCCAYLGH